MTTNALAVYDNFDMLQRASMALYKSGYWPDAKSEAQAIVKVMAGAELGLPPFASMTGIHIVEPYISACHFVWNNGEGNHSQVHTMSIQQFREERREFMNHEDTKNTKG